MDTGNHQYVVDGGSLLYRIIWRKDKTYGEIAESCAKFVCARYGKIIVVFDGYDGKPSTEDMVHLRHAEKHSPREASSTDDTISSLSKEDSLCQSVNKSNFVSLVGMKLEEIGCQVKYATGDADRDIAVTAVNESLHQHVTVIGEDTDLLVLMLFYTTKPSSGLIYKVTKKLQRTVKSMAYTSTGRN